MTYEDPDSGIGCKMIRNSKNSKIGKGPQEIIKSIQNRHIEIALKIAGWDHTTRTTWDFEERDGGNTQVTWTYASYIGKNILHKYMCAIFKSNIERDHVQGLQQLKTHVEQKMASVNTQD